jgi:hypothetical protein
MGQLVEDVKSGLSLTPPYEIKKYLVISAQECTSAYEWKNGDACTSTNVSMKA